MPKVSIIIPVYNSEQYLNECIESVINQTETDIEIICINDLSTDNSLTILNNYAKKDNRIKIINLKENSGVSNARNIGLDNASGKFICFLDSDDFIEKDFCKLLMDNINKNNSDLACGGHCKVNINKHKISRWLAKDSFSKNVFEDILLYTKHRNVTQKLFKKDIIQNNKIRFETTLHYMEDALFLITYLSYCKKISGVNKVLYNVRINFKSLCRNPEFIERRKKESKIAKNKINKIISSKKNQYF